MVKAEIKKKDGTHIIIDGSEAEVRRIIAVVQNNHIVKEPSKKSGKKSPDERMSIADMLHELKEEGFFDQPKSLVEIKNALSEKGMIYALSTLSGKVIAQVRKRNLGRIKKDNKWQYVRR